MQTEQNETPQAPEQEAEMNPQELALAALDELAGIRTALVSMLQLVCSIPPFKGVLGVSDDGEIYQLPKASK